MDFTISPLKGVGDIRFGMSPDEVRQLIGGDCRSFNRTPQSHFPCDFFEKIGTFFYYDSNGMLEAIEFSLPAKPTVHGVQLLQREFKAARDVLASLDNQIEYQIDGAIAYQLGISIWAPLAKDDPSAWVESVLAFRPGYYN